MTNPISLKIQQNQTQNLKQIQRLMMSSNMQQAIYLLQLPILELVEVIENELESNSIIESIDEENFESENETSSDIKIAADLELELESKHNLDLNLDVTEQDLTFNDSLFEVLLHLDENFQNSWEETYSHSEKRTVEEDKLLTYSTDAICELPSLYQHLIQQSLETFDNCEDRKIAEALIGNFDSNGFLAVPLNEIAILYNFEEQKLENVLKLIQEFEPYGVGARSIHESLLIQLRCQHKENTLAYTIIEKHYDELLHNRITAIQEGLGCTLEKIMEALTKEISHLDLHPGTLYSRELVQLLVPDIFMTLDGDDLIINVNHDFLPLWRINPTYRKMLLDDTVPIETKKFIQEKILSAKWLQRMISERASTLERIAIFLSKKQRDFFLNPEGQIAPLTMKIVADELNLNESTITRAIANKCISSPRGLFPLRYFFSGKYVSKEGKNISSQSVSDLLQEIIDKEDKKKPYSDAALSNQLQNQGIVCARRTIAKYRMALSLGNAQQRKKYV